MAKKITKKRDTFTALTGIAPLPKVGVGSSGYDISLGFSYRYALEIASDTLEEVPESLIRDIHKDIYQIFQEWRDENGVYPPHAGELFGLGSKKGPEPAKDYCKRIVREAELADEEPNIPKPWECCPFVTTPLGLFWKLIGDGYEPLKKFLEQDWLNYEKVLALLILLTDNPESEHKSSDCIESGLRLASFKLAVQQKLIKEMKPDYRAALNRKNQKLLKTKAKKEEKERMILSAYKECCTDYGEGNFPYKEITARTQIPESTVCKYLKNAGLGRYKSK